MATRAVQQVLCYAAWDTSANAYKTGDSANHTLRWIKDGTASATTNATAEVDATNLPGIYKVTMTSTETDCLEGVLGGKSSTANVVLIPTHVAFEYIPNAAAGASGGLPLSVDAAGRVDVLKINGTSQTARDLGASVLLSSGTGTGQVLLTSGKVDVNDKTGFALSSAGVQAIWDALSSALTTVGSIGKRLVDYLTGDAYALLGAPAGASVSADIAAVKSDTGAILGQTGTTGVVVGSIAANAITASAIATGAITATKFAASAIDAAALSTDAAQEIRDAVWAKVFSELTVDPGATPAASDAVMLGFMAIRNKRETDSGLGTDKIHNSAGTAILSATISDAAGVFTKAKYA